MVLHPQSTSNRPTHDRDPSSSGHGDKVERLPGTSRKDAITREKALQDSGLKDYVCIAYVVGIIHACIAYVIAVPFKACLDNVLGLFFGTDGENLMLGQIDTA